MRSNEHPTSSGELHPNSTVTHLGHLVCEQLCHSLPDDMVNVVTRLEFHQLPCAGRKGGSASAIPHSVILYETTQTKPKQQWLETW